MSNQSQESTTPIPIILWCCPRSCSTAFERSWMQRQDTRIWHEPLSQPFYYGKDRPALRYSDSVCKDSEHYNTTVQSAMENLLDVQANNQGTTKSEPCKYIFIKDMAQFIFGREALARLHKGSAVFDPNGEGEGPFDPIQEVIENPTVIPTALLRCFKHAFLVRTPQKSVPSYWKCVEQKAAGFEFFDGAEAGYEELRLLHKYLTNPNSTFNKPSSSSTSNNFSQLAQKQVPNPPLIDASVLLAHPEHTMKEFCKALEVPFSPAMLSWESGPVEEWKSWSGYHKDAENSSGFRKETDASEEAIKAAKAGMPKNKGGDGASTDDASAAETEKKKKELPQDVLDTISRSMDAYNYLFAQRTIKSPVKPLP